MADIECAVCGEPWDSAHIAFDCPAWIRDNFRRGAGCESCYGEPPDVPESVQADLILAHARAMDPETRGGYVPESLFGGPRPQWKPFEPSPVPLSVRGIQGDPVPAVCAGCGVSITENEDMPGHVRDPRDVPLYLEWTGGERVHYESGAGPFPFGDLYRAPDPDPDAFIFLDGNPYCPGCVENCGECGAPIFARTELQGGDTYDIGQSFANPLSAYGTPALCIDCLERIPLCANCGGSFGDSDDLDSDGLCTDCRAPDPACEECGDDTGPFNADGLCTDCARDVQADGD